MVVRKTIEHVRSRPHKERHAFAVLGAIIVMGIVGFVWVFFFFRSLQEPQREVQQIENVQQ